MTNISSDWQKVLEMHIPDCVEKKHDHESLLAEYTQSKRQQLAQVEEFIHILNDWIEEALPRLDNVVLKSQKSKRKIVIEDEEE